MPPTPNIPDLEKTYNLLNNINLYLLIFAGIIAIAIGVFSYLSSRKSGELMRAKDVQVRSELKGKDVQIALANQRAAEADEKAESERLARLQLEAKLAPRMLTADQQTRLISVLKPFSGVEADIVIFGNTPEIGNISKIILKCLQDANWNTHVASAAGGTSVVTGVVVGVRSNADESIEKAAIALVLALQSMEIDANTWNFDKMPYPGIYFGKALTKKAPMKIFIGSKP